MTDEEQHMTDEGPRTDIEQGRYDPAPQPPTEEPPATDGPGAHPVPPAQWPGAGPDIDGADADETGDRWDEGL